MITITAKSKVQPGTAATFKETAKPLVAASQKEAGNISYDLFEDVSNPEVLTFIEQWADNDAIEAHNATKHFTEILPKLSELTVEPIEITVYKSAY